MTTNDSKNVAAERRRRIWKMTEGFFGSVSKADIKSETTEYFMKRFQNYVNIVMAITEPDKQDTEKALWDEIKYNIPAELFRRRNKACESTTHEANLGKDIDDSIFDADLVRLYIARVEDDMLKQQIDLDKLPNRVSEMLSKTQHKHITKDFITNIYSNFKDDKRSSQFIEFRDSLQYDGVSTYEHTVNRLERLIKPILVDHGNSRLYAEAFYHFMWQVKRRMFNRKVEQHMGPILLSEEQGKGKTLFLRSICSPFYRAEGMPDYDEPTFQDLDDTSGLRELLKTFILQFDEMAGITRRLAIKFRKFVTADTQRTRTLRSHDRDRSKIRMTICGTANGKRLSDIFPSFGKERRLLGVEVKDFAGVHPERPEDLAFIGHLNEEQMKAGHLFPLEGFDATSLWQGVDENLDCQLPVKQIRILQGLDTPDVGIDAFVVKYRIAFPLVESDRQPYPVESVYALFRQNFQAIYRNREVPTKLEFTQLLLKFLNEQEHDNEPDSNNENHVTMEQFKHQATKAPYRKVMCLHLARSGSLSTAINSFLNDGVKSREDPLAHNS